uniref:Uncharacterized protein n=1 Tax=Leersia perrieri TaxID=77586 RepID=A0A0D9WQW7_9ORYZ
MENSLKGTQEFSLEASHDDYTQQLELLLKQLGIHNKPVHHGEQVICGFRKDWRMKIYIQGQEDEHQGHVLKSVHLRASKEAALQDASCEAFMRLCKIYSHEIAGTPFFLHPCVKVVTVSAIFER